MTIDQYLGFPFVWVRSGDCANSFLLLDWWVVWYCSMNVTLLSPPHKSKAGSPSIRNPASNEMISDSVELLNTDVCFWRIQRTGTNVRLPKIQKIPPEVDFESSKVHQKNLSLDINPVDNAEPCYPHDNIQVPPKFLFLAMVIIQART